MRNTWSRQQLEMLQREYADSSTDLLAVILDKPKRQVTGKANYLGLKKSPEYLERVRAATGAMRWRNAQNMVHP